MADTSHEVQVMDCSQPGGGMTSDVTYEMQSECGKNHEDSLSVLGRWTSCEQEAPQETDYRDNSGFDTSTNAYNEMGFSSASLEHSISKSAVGGSFSCGSHEASEEELLSLSEREEKRRQAAKNLDQRALQEVRHVSEKENVNIVAQEKERKIFQLEAELRDMREFVERIQSERLEAEKGKEISERRVLDIQFQLEAAESVAKDLKAVDKLKHEAFEKQQLNLNEALEKLEMQSRFLDSGSVEANRAKDSIELQRSCQDMQQILAEKEGLIRNLRDCQEQLRLSFKSKERNLQQEKEEIITALEASELKSEEQRVKLRELENDLTRFKGQAANLEKRCASAESKASETSSLVDDLQFKLDSTNMELFELKNSNVEVNTLRLRLQECESALSHATGKKALAETSLRELKLREEHLNEVEQGHKALEERLKWRNEQFQSLEEAHSKVRSQFKEKSVEWDTERAGMLLEIDSLQGNLDSKERALHELQDQLRMVHQALSHEESRRKVVELQAAEARQGLEQATAGYEAAQSAIESLREQTSTEIGTLRNTLGAKDRQLKELQVKHVHMEQEYAELKDMENEYRIWQSSHGEQQKQLQFMKEKITSVLESHDNLKIRLKEQEKEFEKERRDLVKALDKANESLTSKEEIVNQLVNELDRVKGAYDHVNGHRSNLDTQLKQSKEQLERAYEEAAASRQALTSLEKSSHVEKSTLLESLHAKDKVIQDLKTQIRVMEQTVAELNIQEEKWLQLRRDYQTLEKMHTQKEAHKNELEKIHNSLLVRVSDKEKAWLAEKEMFAIELQLTQEKANEAEKQLKETHFKFEWQHDAILKLEMRCAAHDKEVAEHMRKAEEARERLALEKLQAEKVSKEAQTLSESLSATLSHRDMAVQKLKRQIEDLESELQQKNELTRSQFERVSLLEKRVKESSEVQCNMEEHIAAMKSQVEKATEELKVSEDARNVLGDELQKSHEHYSEVKKDLEGKLEAVHRDWSASCMRLKVATQQLEEESAQKELLLNDLDLKEGSLTELMVEKKYLLVEKAALQHLVQVLETKKVELIQEVENSKTAINQLCNKYEVSQSSLSSSCKEVKDLQAKLQNAQKVGTQLLEAEEKNRDLEGYLKAAKAIAQDKEEKLAASEWAVQQLALDVGKAKAALTQKDREEACLRDELADVERQLRGKEGELIEMELYLEEALVARDSMQGEVDQLHQRMEDLDRGAADWKRKELDMSAQLEVVGAALEEKREAIVASELEVKRGNDLREVMEGAIESLKLQLLDEQRALSAERKDMNRLCEDLEQTKCASNSSSELVKELQGRLQQLEQSSEKRIKQFQSTLSELQEELSVAHAQLENYQNNTKLLVEESLRYKEKSEVLLDLNDRKDSALKDMETQLFCVQSGALEQSNLLEQRDQELKVAKQQLQCQDEKQIRLEESLSRIQTQRSELQLENEELEVKLRKLQGQFEASSSESVLKSKEIDNLMTQVEQLRVIVAQEGETKTLMTKLADELKDSSQALQDREVHLCNMKTSLDDAQRELQVLQVALAGKDSDTELLHDKLSAMEKKYEDSEGELLKLQEAMTLAQGVLMEKSGVISSYMSMMNVLEVETAEWKEKAESSTKEVNSLNKELQASTRRAMESQQQVSEMKETLEAVQAELKENTEKLLLHVSSVEELQGHLKDWKEKSAAAVQEKQVLMAALEVAELRYHGKDTEIETLRAALENAEVELSKYVEVVKTLQEELRELRGKEVAAIEEGRKLQEQLEVSQKKSGLNQELISELQELLERSGNELKEKTQQNSYLSSSLDNLQREVLEWKGKVADAETEVEYLKLQLKDVESKGIEHQEEVLQIKGAMMSLEHSLLEERKNLEILSGVEHDLIEERKRVTESSLLIADLHAKIEHWKTKAKDAAKEGERIELELTSTMKAVNNLTLQVGEHQERERSMKELNDKLQVELTVAQDEVLARKEKMEIILHQLQESQESVKDLLAPLQVEHKKLISELESGGGFDCTFEIDSCDGLQSEDSSKALKGKSAEPILRSVSGDGRIGDNLLLEDNPMEDCTLGAVNEALEKELAMLRLHAAEAQHEAQQLAAKLDAALSNVATKNLIIKQVNDEILGLRSLVKKLEQETLLLQYRNHGDAMQNVPSRESERGEGQETTVFGKRKAESQDEVNQYLELADSLVRKNIRLEKQIDGLQRKNRVLQKQAERLQMLEKSSSDKERKALDPVDCSPEQLLRGFSRKSNLNVLKPAIQDRKTLQDICNGKVLCEIDENSVTGTMERSQISRRPPVSPAAVQQKKARRIKDEV